jgi:hypothetical protein
VIKSSSYLTELVIRRSQVQILAGPPTIPYPKMEYVRKYARIVKTRTLRDLACQGWRVIVPMRTRLLSTPTRNTVF